MSIPTGWELILLLVVLVLLFGASKLPTAARSIGQSLRIFKAETKGLRADEDGYPQRPQQQPAPGTTPQTTTPQQVLPPSTPPTSTPIEEPQRGSDTSR